MYLLPVYYFYIDLQKKRRKKFFFDMILMNGYSKLCLYVDNNVEVQ